MTTPRKVLIIGANGFLGSHLAADLSHSFEVICSVRHGSDCSRLEPFLNRVKVIKSEPHDTADVVRSTAPYAVINAAVCYGGSSKLPEVLRTNVLLPLELVQALSESEGTVFVHIDTFFTRSSGYEYLPAYQMSKRHAVQWIAGYAKELKIINARLEHMYGAGDAPSKAIPTLLSAIASNQPRLMLSLGEQRRDFIHIDDVTSALRTLLLNVDVLPQELMHVDVGSGKAVTLKEMLLLAKELSGSSTELCFGALPYRTGEPMESKADPHVLESLGWRPSTTLREGLARLLGHIKGQNRGEM
jgi:nucleoside-diphosphate-sugar epimerase